MNVGIFAAKEYPGPHQLYLTLENAEVAKEWQSVCQLFILALLTRRGSVPMDPDYGTDFVTQLWGGAIRTGAQLKAAFDFAVLDVSQYLARTGYIARRAGGARLGKVILRRWAINNGHAELWADFYDATGRKIAVYWVPVNQPGMEIPV